LDVKQEKFRFVIRNSVHYQIKDFVL